MNTFLNKNRKSIIRFLAGISFLIFFLPFFQMCSDENIKNDSDFFKAYGNAKTEKQKEIAFQQVKKDFTLNGYDLAMSFEAEFWGFTAILILNITLLVCFLRNHYNQLLICFLNMFLILISLFGLAIYLWSFAQIRYGFFLYLINSIALFYFVYKEQETPYNTR